MTKLICVKNNGVEFAVDTETGDPYITIAGYSRLSGLNNATIRQRCRRMIKRQLTNPQKGEPRIEAKPLCWSDAMKSIQLDTGRGVFKTLLIPMSKASVWLKKDNPAIVSDIEALIADIRGMNE